MRGAVLGFLLGVMGLQLQAILPSLWWVPLIGIPPTLLWLFRRRLSDRAGMGFVRGVVALCCAALGFAWAAWRAEVRLGDELPREWESRDVELTGAIASLPQRNDRGIRFEFDVEAIATAGAVVPGHLSLAWYDENNRKTGEVARAPDVQPGERWTLTLRLKRPHGTMNPHGFDFEAWAVERSIRATGYVRQKGVNEKQAQDAAGIGYSIDRLRLRIRDAMNASLEGKPYAGVLVALTIGQQNAIPAEQWRDFWRTGTGHLISISGLHITMIASLAYWLAFRCWARLPPLARHVPAQRVAAAVGALAALAYSLIAGFSVPTQRTFFMLATVAVLLASGRAASGSRILLAALGVVLLIDPWAVLAPGFWLSFGAVAMIFFVSSRRRGEPGAWSSALRTQAAVTLGLLPMTLVLFQEVSLVSPIANAFAIPLVSFVVVPLSLMGAAVSMLTGVDALLTLAHGSMHLCHAVLAWLAAFDHAVWQSHAPAAWTAALAMIAVLLMLAPRGTPARWVAPLLCVPMFVVQPPAPAPGDFQVHVLDVGQGLASVVRTATHALVFDTGPSWNPDADSGNRIVVPFLRGEGIAALDSLIVSHADDDHSGGAASVIAARNPAWVMTSMPADHDSVAGAREVMRCEAGDHWHWDGVDFDILHPAPADYDRSGIKSNNMGCVLMVSGPGGRILFTADIEKNAERELLDRFRESPEKLRADVMVIPHHGSRTSSTEAFLDAVSAKVALLPVGYRNRFRHPNAQVMERYLTRDIRVHRSDTQGALSVRFVAGRPPVVSGYRARFRRYWVDAPASNESTAGEWAGADWVARR